MSWFRPLPALACLTIGVAVAALAHSTAEAQQANPNAAEEAAIVKNAEAFAEAFQKQDAKALAALFTPEADYTDQRGRRFKGREEIEKTFAQHFADHKGMKLRIDIGPIRFPAPGVAVEDGTAEVLHPDGLPPTRVRYTNVLVRREGKWYLDSVRDAPYTAPSNREKLEGLEWMIGFWAEDDAAEGPKATVRFGWTDDENFIVSRFNLAVKDVELHGGTQWIGWDPTTKTIRSWTFDTHGGFADGTWTKTGDTWTHKTNFTLRDGTKVTATDVVTRVDADTITVAIKDRTANGKPQPEVKPVRMKRVK